MQTLGFNRFMYAIFIKLTERIHHSEINVRTPISRNRPDAFLNSRSQDMQYKFQDVDKSANVDTHHDILMMMCNFQKQKRENPSQAQIGVLVYLHPSDVSTCESCDFYFLKEDSLAITHQKINNPKRTKFGALRNRESTSTIHLDGNLSTLFQMYAMLDLYKGDNMASEKIAKLKDPFAQQLYDWEVAVFSKRSTLGIREMERFIRNAIVYAKLPMITLVFVEDADSCSFSFQSKGKSPGASHTREADPNHEEDKSWLDTDALILFDEINAEPDTAKKIELSDFKLTFPLSWGMCKEIALHEVSHYITFLSPLKSKLNQGAIKLSYQEYSMLFCGHGALYCSIYLFMLYRFNIFDKESLYFNFRRQEIPFFEIDTLDPQHLELQLIDYVAKKRREKKS